MILNKGGILVERIIIDEHFLEFIIGDKDIMKNYISKLSDIHMNCSLYPWEHNVILDKSFVKVVRGKKCKGELILGAMHPVNEWDEEEGLHSSVIKHSIALADKKPYKVYILTNETEVENYKENKHYKGYVEFEGVILVKGGAEALAVIDELHSKLTN